MTLLIDTTSGDYDYTYLSLGAGVQSSALLVLSCTDERVPKPDPKFSGTPKLLVGIAAVVKLVPMTI